MKTDRQQCYCLLLAAYLGCYSMSYKSKVTSHRFTRLYPVWIGVYCNRLITKSIIDYLILASIQQVSIEVQSSLIILIWEVCYLLSKLDYSKFYIVTFWSSYIYLNLQIMPLSLSIHSNLNHIFPFQFEHSY